VYFCAPDGIASAGLKPPDAGGGGGGAPSRFFSVSFSCFSKCGRSSLRTHQGSLVRWALPRLQLFKLSLHIECIEREYDALLENNSGSSTKPKLKFKSNLDYHPKKS
jgi:hypothetical protein